MSLSLLSRYAFFAFCVIFTLASLPFMHHECCGRFTAVTSGVEPDRIFDLLQTPPRGAPQLPDSGQHPPHG